MPGCVSDRCFRRTVCSRQRKCISYTTIELRGAISEQDREGIGHHLFGCDICQDVCPWNRRAPATADPSFQSKDALYWPQLEALLNFKDDDWKIATRGTPLKRAKVRGLLRNLMVVVGNSDYEGFYRGSNPSCSTKMNT
jgi:epoxyqueuosine reductase